MNYLDTLMNVKGDVFNRISKTVVYNGNIEGSLQQKETESAGTFVDKCVSQMLTDRLKVRSKHVK